MIIEAIRRDMRDPRALKERAALIRLGRNEVGDHRDGILPVRGWMAEAMNVVFGREAFRSAESFIVMESFRQMVSWLSSATAFTWISTPGNSRQDQLAAGRAYMRLDLASAMQGMAIHPHSQPLQEVTFQAEQRRDIQALLANKGETIQMIARLGHVATPVPPTPCQRFSLTRGGELPTSPSRAIGAATPCRGNPFLSLLRSRRVCSQG